MTTSAMAGGGVSMSAANIPAGTKAAILRAVLAEKYPKHALAPIAARFGLTYQDLRTIIDKAGYPSESKMRKAAEQLEADEIADQARPPIEADTPAAPSTAAAGDVDVDDHEVLRTVKVADLHVDPENVRDLPKVTDPDIEDLADSMTEIGLVQPIIARRHEGQLVVVAGHRRLVAARKLKWASIRCIVRGPMPSDQVIAAMLIENGQRKDLDPIEEARGLRRLKAERDCGDLELARMIGKSQPHVSGRLALLSLSAEDQAAIRAGDMTLIEGTAKGRLNSGKVGTKGVDRNWHLGPNHDLAQLAKARCRRLQHKTGRIVGGMGCGECWESVIRADERDHLHEVNAKLSDCIICGAPVEKTKNLEGASA